MDKLTFRKAVEQLLDQGFSYRYPETSIEKGTKDNRHDWLAGIVAQQPEEHALHGMRVMFTGTVYGIGDTIYMHGSFMLVRDDGPIIRFSSFTTPTGELHGTYDHGVWTITHWGT